MRVAIFELSQRREPFGHSVVEFELAFLRMKGQSSQVQLAEIRHAGEHICIEPSGLLYCTCGRVYVKSSHVLCHRVVASKEGKSSFNSDIVASQLNAAINDPASYRTEPGRYS